MILIHLEEVIKVVSGHNLVKVSMLLLMPSEISLPTFSLKEMLNEKHISSLMSCVFKPEFTLVC